MFARCFLRLGMAIAFSWLAAAGANAVVSAEDPPAKYLSSDLADRISTILQGWGELGIDTSVVPLHKPAMKLRIKDQEYEHGLGHHASGEIVIDLAGQFKTFQADVGIQWQGGQDQASVIFRVLADDKLVFDSGVMREGDAPRPVHLSVAGVEELTLVADEAGDGITCDCANWADARLVADPAAAKLPPVTGVDIGPFGQVATWDPARMTGTAADRVQEFPAEDVRLHREVLPEADGMYRVPLQGGHGCIGLRWDENRLVRQAALVFADAANIPAAETIQLQSWSGESAWQGSWEHVTVAPEQVENRLVWNFTPRSSSRGTQKIRWVFSDLSPATPVVVKGLQAYSRSRWITLDLRIESTQPATGDPVQLALLNGLFVGTSSDDLYHRTWDRSKPLTVKVRAAVTKRYKADRTVLQFQFPESTFGVAVEDLVSNDCVYAPHAGVFLTREPAPITRDEYLQKIAQQQTLLAQVRDKPDQTFAQALAKVHNPIQDLGPMMVSLACDSRKFVAEREGRLLFDSYNQFDDPERPIPTQWQLTPRFGRVPDQQIARHLTGAWLPAPTTTVTQGDLTYRQCTYVAPVDEQAPTDSPAWVRQRAVAVVEWSVTNQGAQSGEASLELTLTPGEGNEAPVVWEQTPEGLIAKAGDRLLVLLDTRKISPLAARVEGATVTISGQLTASGSAGCVAYVPAWPAMPTEGQALMQTAPHFPRFEQYWTAMLAPATQVELPDNLLTNVIRASQVHCLLAARNEDAGRRVSPWISSDRYGPLESEANSIVRGMSLLGHEEFARRSLDYFVRRYNEAGYLTTGYTMVGTGEHLWTLAEHEWRTEDRPWLIDVAPELVRVCKWVAAQRAKTKLLDARGEKVPEYGLFPPGVTADWNRYAYRFFNDAQYCTGLAAAARVLSDIEHPDAPALLDEAREYREDLVRAYRWTQGRTPVVRLEDGTWVPGDPALLDCPGRVEDFLPGEDGNRSWAYSVEIGAHHLAATGILNPTLPDVAWMMDYLEEQQFLRTGMGDYPEATNRQDPYNLGGFAKVQPYYGRFAEVYAGRDDVRPFIRAYFNAIPSLLSLENLSFWEHFHNIAGWNKTHETGWFLCQSRIMLVREQGDELWLAPFATSAWFQDGQRISVREAPTCFGHVSYTIESAVAKNRIDATIESPTRKPPRRIVLRVRHPERKPIQSVTVQGQPHQDFDPSKETITLAPAGSTLRVQVQY
ncbi:MAG: NPCBM/NEW2 domain-containing protein [Pirellulaceae bacterium]